MHDENLLAVLADNLDFLVFDVASVSEFAVPDGMNIHRMPPYLGVKPRLFTLWQDVLTGPVREDTLVEVTPVDPLGL